MTNKSTSFIENKSQLIKYFSDGIKKDTNLRIGVEHEKFLFNRKDLKRIDYEKLKKVFDILKDKGWKIEYEKEKQIGLRKENQTFKLNYENKEVEFTFNKKTGKFSFNEPVYGNLSLQLQLKFDLLVKRF